MERLTNLARHWLLLVAVIPAMGATWREINRGLPSTVVGASGLAIDSATPSTLYSWTNGGALFKSMDGAASWKIVNGITGVYWLVVDPKDSSTIYAGTNHGLVKTVDGGETWTGFDTGLGTGWVSPLVIDSRDSNTVYAVLFAASGGVIKSTNRGASWKTSNAGLPAQPLSLTLDPKTPSTLYAVALDGRIFKSTNGAESWIAIKASSFPGVFVDSVLFLAVDPSTPSTIYAGSFAAATGPRGTSFDAGQGSISKSTDGGQNWRAVRAGIPADAFVRSLTIDPASPSNIYASYIGFDGGWGILKSADGGETWSALNNGLPSGNFIGSNVLVDPPSPATIYAGYIDRGGTGTGGLLKSTDGGASWRPANAGRSFVDLRALAIDRVNAGTMYAGIGTDGLFKSVDGGGNWEKLAAFQLPAAFGFSGRAYTRSLVIDFRRPNILYALVGRTDGCHYTDELLFKSTDSGASWSSIGPPMSGCVLTGLVMDPTDPNSLYLEWPDSEGGSALFKSTDGGASWSDLAYFACCIVNALVIDPTNPATLYGGTPSGVLKSIDGGATWSNTGLSTGVNVLALDPANPTVLYAATGGSGLSGFGGLFKSIDGGASWAPINDGLASLLDTRSPVTALLIDPRGSNVLFAATSGYGVFRSIDGGANWTPFNDGLTNLDIRVLTLAPGNTLNAGTSGGILAVSLAPVRPFRSRR